VVIVTEEGFAWSRELRDRVFRFLRRLARNPEDAEDLTHQTYLRLAESTAAAQIGCYSAYVMKTALHVWSDFSRRRRNSPVSFVSEDSIPPPSDTSSHPGDEVSAQQQLHRMQKALDALPPRRRLVFCLRRLEGLSVTAVAKRLGLSPKTVKREFSSALEALHRARTDEGVPTDE
jgi:RNA polymerase sigma-70 factor (ECF subfamily)